MNVLWLRHRDTHLLSAGENAYTADPRFRAFLSSPGSTWGLRVSSTRPSDGGVYECQISTTPPISAFTYLTVVAHCAGETKPRVI
ncbi:Lachesin [Orchesella cincta]|uniref:Lachesin n=1 Tax=Orchesella cincta TaxID=48709 RepID=A0A1D2NA52_ORCCI|nr:Lachesin [Orchesella cincta]